MPYIKNDLCCRCKMPLPINHFEYRASVDDKPAGIYPICANCAGMWGKEALKHFKEWIKEGVTDGTKK